MSLSIAQTTLNMALQLVATQAEVQRSQALAREVALLKQANATPEAALKLLESTLESVGLLVDTVA